MIDWNNSNIEDALHDGSSFYFEEEIASNLRKLGFEVQHCGTYIDPIKEERREFDIKTSLIIQQQSSKTSTRRLSCSIECTTLPGPLVVFTQIREESASYLEILTTKNLYFQLTGMTQEKCSHCVVRETARQNLYLKGQVVGISHEQLTLTKISSNKSKCSSNSRENPLKCGGDEIFFKKLNQSIAAICNIAENDVFKSPLEPIVHFCIPIVVINDGVLFTVHNDGDKFSSPILAEEVTYWLGASIQLFRNQHFMQDFNISHVHIVTKSHLTNFLSTLKDKILNSLIDF